MDRPGALAVKLNTRDRKGSGAHPGYSPKLSPAMDRSPAPWGHTDLSSPGAGQGLHSPGPSPKDQSQPSPSLVGHRQRRALALAQLPLFHSSGADLREHLECPWGRAVRRAPSQSGGAGRGQQQQQAVVGAGGAAAVISVVWSPTGRWRGEFLVFQCAGLV